MYYRILLGSLLLSSVYTRHLPRFADLDEEDQQLFRAAFDTPSYDQQEYEEEDDLPLGKLDLLKDGLWMIKAKINEMKAFDKALVANLLSTKLKLKELLLKSKMKPVKKPYHKEIEKKKPYYYEPSYPQYEQQYAGPQYAVPQYAGAQYGQQQHPHDPYYGM